jgi:hypothetical protein
MRYEAKHLSAPCSRRGLLLGAVAAVGTVAVAAADARTATAADKISEQAVAYQDHPDGEKDCSKCANFQPPSSCRMVDGTISPHGYCRIFAPSQAAELEQNASSFVTS